MPGTSWGHKKVGQVKGEEGSSQTEQPGLVGTQPLLLRVVSSHKSFLLSGQSVPFVHLWVKRVTMAGC